MSFRKGSKVWVEDKDLAWTEAEVVEARDKLVTVITAQRKKVIASNLMNLCLAFMLLAGFYLNFL